MTSFKVFVSATPNTPNVAIEPKREIFLFKKLAANNAAAVASTVPANLTDFSGKPNTF